MKVFLSGIAGTGMSSLAGLFTQRGDDVAGSDMNFYPPVDKILEQMKARLHQGYSAANIKGDVDLCVLGNVLSRGNPEAERVLNEDLPYLSMAEALYRYFIRGKQSVVVAGTHGKTTISTFIAHLLSQAGLEPGFFIGGKPKNFPSNYQMGRGEYFVTEGDEYETSFFDRSAKFLKYHPKYLILSALEYDHLDFYKSEELYLDSFRNLVNQVPSGGIIISHGDFVMNEEATTHAFTPVVKYGMGDADYCIDEIIPQDKGYQFTLRHGDSELMLNSHIPGEYNIWNITAGVILGIHLGISPEVIQSAVESFQGVERRLTLINSLGSTLFFEDFAHHPTSIKNVLESIKMVYPDKKLIACFEPRSWSLRRNFFQHQLADSLSVTDELLIKDVYQKEKIPSEERLDIDRIKTHLLSEGKKVTVLEDYPDFEKAINALDFNQSNVVVLISNGGFGNLPGFVKQLK